MPKFFHLTRIKKKTSRRKRKIFRFPQIRFKAFSLIVYSGLVVLFLAYLVQINSIATKGYVISELETKLSELAKQNNSLQAEALSLQTTDNVVNKLEDMGLVSSEEVEYINIIKPTVAVR